MNKKEPNKKKTTTKTFKVDISYEEVKPFKFNGKDEDNTLYSGYAPYRNQFRPWIAHEDAILIMDSEEDEEFINKLFISQWTNNLISDLSGVPLIQSNY